MPLMLHGASGVMTPQLYPVPGTIWPNTDEGRTSPVSAWRAPAAPATTPEPYNSGALPPHDGSNRSKLNADASPLPLYGGDHLYIRRPISKVRVGFIFQVSWTNHAKVFWIR